MAEAALGYAFVHPSIIADTPPLAMGIAMPIQLARMFKMGQYSASSDIRIAGLGDRGMAMLMSNGWLGKANPEFQAAMLRQAIWRSAERGDPIAVVGDEIGGIFGMVEGVAGISVPERPECGIVHLLHPGDWHGQHPVITGTPRIHSTVARSACVYGLVPQAGLQRALKSRPEWWKDIAVLADSAARLATHTATDLMVPDSERRTASVLLRIAGHWPGRFSPVCEAELPISQDELSAMAAQSRNTLSRIVGKFREEGLIEVGYRKIVMLDIAGLKTIANPDYV